MKKVFLLLLVAITFGKSDTGFGQTFTSNKSYTTKPEKKNYTFFTQPVLVRNEEITNANKGFENDPELGILYPGAPANDYYELLGKRTESSKTFAKAGTNGREIMVRSSTFPMHYTDGQGKLRTMSYTFSPGTQAGVFAINNKAANLMINTTAGNTSIINNDDKTSISYNHNLELVYISPDGTESSLGAASWKNYTAGDDGVYIKDAWPGIDIEITKHPAGLKTNFSINHALPAYANGKLALRDHMELSKGLSMGAPVQKDYYGDVSIKNGKGTEIFKIVAAVAYERYDASAKVMPVNYTIGAGNILDIDVPGDLLNKAAAYYPLIIDPLVVTNSVPSNNFSFYTAYCNTVNNVTIPAATTITDIQMDFIYKGHPATGATSFNFAANYATVGSCTSPPAPAVSGCTGSTAAGSTCNAAGVSIYADVLSCVPVISCTAYTLPVTLASTQDVGTTGGACSNTYYFFTTPFEVDVYGTTTALPVPISGLTSLCVGGTTTLTDGASTGWPWSSSNTGVATINAVTGAVVAVGTGVTTITYGYAPCAVTTTLSVNAVTPITGSLTLCLGSTTALTNATAGGAWSTTPGTGSVTVGGTGIVTGSTAGTATVKYTYPGGCIATTVVTVGATTTAITGTLTVCAGSTTALTDATTGGTWTSSNLPVGTVGAATGIVAGLTAGTTIISYTLAGGCAAGTIVTVTALPGNILGTLSVCQGATTILSDLTAGGVWGTTAGSGSVSVAGGTVTGTTAGTAIVSYTIGGSCSKTVIVTVNPIPGAILGSLSVCQGSATALSDALAGGTWTSSNLTTGTVGLTTGVVAGLNAGTTTISYFSTGGCATSAVVTVVTSPSAILGTTSVCQGASTTLTDAVGGGNWTTTAGSGSVTDPGGVVTGVTAGTAIVSYSFGGGSCFVTTIVTVNPLPGAILGSLSVCQGSATALSDALAGGTWTSSNLTTGTVGLTTGVVAGLNAGTTTISYFSTGGCTTSAVVTVVTSPSAILGTTSVCQGASTTLTDAVGGGNWTTTAGSGSVTDPGGVVTGVTVGTAIVSYSFGGGSCFVTTIVTVNTIPTAILGTPNVCVGLNTLLTDAVTGGVWSSSNTGVATVPATPGLVTGVGTGGTATITYTMPGNCFITTTVTVNPAPSAINGTLTVCQGLTTALTNTVTGGTWASSVPAVGSVAPLTGGLVTGVSGGTTVITYTSANCTPVTAVVTVNPVAAITGTLTVCVGLTTQLTDVIAGGTWTSSAAAATVGSASGLVTGIGAGTSTIVYTFPTGCSTSIVVTVNASPPAIVGTPALCVGNTFTFTDPTGGGAWTSSNTGVATIGSGTGVATGVGTLGGVTTIIYTLPAGCIATQSLTVNPLPAPISGTLSVCAGLSTTLTDATAGGTWSSNPTAIAIIGSSTGSVTGMATGTSIITFVLPTGCSATAILTVNVSPVAIEGNHSMCVGIPNTLTDPTAGGTWSSSNPIVTIGSSSGIALGSASGTSTITYTLSTGCMATTTVTVNPQPAAISGATNGCIGFTATLSDITAGGTWSSSTTFVATIGSTSGFVNALNTGNTTIDYTLSTGCFASMVFTVNPSPGPISGTANICQGATATFTDTPPGGIWSSSTTNAVVGSSSGVVAGNTPGPAIISYTLPTTCFSIYSVVINPAPGAISGPNQVCVASAITLADGVAGGTWSATPGSGTATISTTGVVTGGAAGVVLISYTTFGCNPATYPVTVNALPTAIMGVGNLCQGSSTSLTDATPGGTWSSSDALVTISSTGVVTGVGTGAGTNISYTLPTGCYVTVPVVVFPVPDSIKGTDSVCQGASVILSDLTPGGVWSSSDGTIALSIAFTGEVDGVVAGNVHISYTLVSGCYVTVPFKVISPLPASLTISQSPDTLLCANSPVTLTANPVNGGTPTFVWELFGSYIGSGPSYPYDPTHGDFITCVMTTHNICASPAVVHANVTLNVYPLVTPMVTISTLSASDTTGYLGDVYTFFTEVTFGGVDPVYQWYENSAPIPGATNTSYTTNVYDSNDTIYCTVSGTSPCDTGSLTGTSNTYIIYGLGFLSASSLSVSGNDLTLFPNPNTGTFTLGGTVNTTANSDVTIEVVDMLGRTVYTGNTTPHNGVIHAEIKLDNDIASGNYLLRVNTTSGSQTFHFVVGGK